MNELALFSGAGGGILGGTLLGFRTVCVVEVEPYAASVLVARQNDGLLPPFPVWDDIRSFDGTEWRGIVDVVSGGFPCQDISAAGAGAGINGTRSGLWREMARVVREVRPGLVLVENSPVLTSRGLGTVLGDLAALGYDAEWGVFGADDAGAPHHRKRIWILGHLPNAELLRCNTGLWKQEGQQFRTGRASRGEFEASCQDMAHPSGVGRIARGQSNAAQGPERREPDRSGVEADVSDTDCQRFEKQRSAVSGVAEIPELEFGMWWESEPDVGRVAHGVAARVDRLKALGNGQVPAVAALAWRVLLRRIGPKK